MKAQYNLDNPWAFYWDYLGKASGAVGSLGRQPRPFDLGPSLTHENWTVNEILAAGLPVSITLGLAAILLACAIGLERRRHRRAPARLDRAMSPRCCIALIGISLPSSSSAPCCWWSSPSGSSGCPVGRLGRRRH